MEQLLQLVFALTKTLIATVFTLLVIASGLLSWENLTLKARLAKAGEEVLTGEIEPGDRLRPMGVVSVSGMRRTLFTEGGSTPMLLFFLSTSCPHCENTALVWNRLAGMTDRRRIEVLGISLDDPGPTRDFVERHGLRFPVSSIADADYPNEHGINGVPTTILVDAGAVVMKVWPGEIDPEAFLDIARNAASMQEE
jgi:peroxiredoxin